MKKKKKKNLPIILCFFFFLFYFGVFSCFTINVTVRKPSQHTVIFVMKKLTCMYSLVISFLPAYSIYVRKCTAIIDKITLILICIFRHYYLLKNNNGNGYDCLILLLRLQIGDG